MKTSYHHGELRSALIGAARMLIQERQGHDFSLSDACRQAGVSTAAPYRHFADKTAIIDEVVAQGFADMTARARVETAAHPAGDRARILALGQVYLAFALAEPALFRMMFGQRPASASDEIALARGRECFQFVVQEVVSYCTMNQVEGDARMIALHLWTLVHGAASLTIDGDYAKVAADISVADILQQGAERLLFSRPRAPVEAAPETGTLP